MLTIDRSFYIPSPTLGAVCRTFGSATVYTWQESHRDVVRYYAKGFQGKRAKPSFFYHFPSAEKRDAYVVKFISDAQASDAYRTKCAQERQAARAAMTNKDLPIGTIMVSSWGYDQTNVDFYKVVGHFGRIGLEVVEVGCKHVEGSGVSHGMADHVVADPEVSPDAKVHRVKMTTKTTFRAPGYGGDYSVHVWDGRPHYRSWYA